ncbi:hypothetical protein [Desulfuromonas sp. CSMB_57]|uniref:hypothetical protein n=1 Tax=Desulfuromonas sp. CSMB_57 TaxID=2807629 RepID=UPI001CD267AB|nr:hypothetical protein [Desulfuromonas sp. CSMB_57]
MTEITEAELVLLEDAARQLGTTPVNVLLHVKRGRLAGREDQGIWRIESASLQQLRQTLEAAQAPSGAAECRPACHHGKACGGCHE